MDEIFAAVEALRAAHATASEVDDLDVAYRLLEEAVMNLLDRVSELDR